MPIELCQKRQSIVAQAGHLLVLGGPGAGKTTVALFKAQARFAALKPGQEVLFLSFSRAAIRQVLLRCKEILTIAERRAVSVQTYHGFCMELLRSHGRLLAGRPIEFLYPGDERVRKSQFDGEWKDESLRLATEESLVCFDLFARRAADLLEGCAALRQLLAQCFPMIIVDEFQDTDNDQWRIVKALAQGSDVFCLADPEQRIFDYRPEIDLRRLDILREHLTPAEFDLGGENHRSPNAGILRFADAVLRNEGPLPVSADVKRVSYQWANVFAGIVHAGVVWTFAQLRQAGVVHPCVAVLCRSNTLVADISAILSEAHVFNGQNLAPVEHDVVWDAELSAAAAIVVATLLEWPGQAAEAAVTQTLRAIASYYQLKNAEHPSNAAANQARKFREAAAKAAEGKTPRIDAAKALVEVHADGVVLVGDPVTDWKTARSVLQGIDALSELFREVRLVRLFRATDTLASALGDRWSSADSYAGASVLVKRILDQEKLVAADRDPRGCILMNIHKSKGKEFDGVVLVEGQHKSPFFIASEAPQYERSRRLLRVALTRARSQVTIIRSQGARSLVD
jgi:DNA helicase II / ATP-dependent DNA helicase PcrA